MFRHFCDYPLLKYVSSVSEIGGVVEADGEGGFIEAAGDMYSVGWVGSGTWWSMSR